MRLPTPSARLWRDSPARLWPISPARLWPISPARLWRAPPAHLWRGAGTALRAMTLGAGLAWGLAAPLSAQDQTAPTEPAIGTPEQVERDVGLITGFVEDKLSNISREVRIEGFDGALSSRATIDRLIISDREGDWLVMEGLVLDWNRASLLRGRVVIQELLAEKITLLRRPAPDPSAPAAEASPLRIPELPVSIEIGAVQADEISLGADILGEAVSAQLSGDMTLIDGSLNTTISASRIDDKTGQFVIYADFDKPSDLLTLSVVADEGENGLAAQLLNLPGRPSVRLVAVGDGSIEDFLTQIELGTGGQERMRGEVHLALVDDGPDSLSVDLAGDISPLFTADYAEFFEGGATVQTHVERGLDGSITIDTLSLQTGELSLTGGLRTDPDGWPQAFSLLGEVRSDAGNAVLLPLPGPRTHVGSLDLDLRYDSAVSPDWTGTLALRDLKRGGTTLPETLIDAAGLIRHPNGSGGVWTLALDYAANGIEVTNAGLAEALGSAITGRIEANGAHDAPTDIPVITMTGPGVELAAQARVAGKDRDFATHVDARIDANRLGRFSDLIGRDLRGAVGVDVTIDTIPLGADLTLGVTGATDDIGIGNARIDPLLAGLGAIDIKAERDQDGTRLTQFDIRTQQASISAQADLSTEETQALLIAQIDDSSLLSPDLSGPARITGTASRPAEGAITTIDMAADLPGAVGRFSAQVDDVDRDYATMLSGDITFTDLAPYSDLAGRSLGGQAETHMVGALRPLEGAATLAVSAQTQDLQLGVPQADPLLHGGGSLVFGAMREASGALHLTGLNVLTDELSASGQGSFVDGGVSADFDARIRETAVLSPDLSGPMHLVGTAARTASGGTEADITATGPGIDLALDATVAALSEDPKRSLATRFDIQADLDDLGRYAALIGRPLNGSADLSLKGTAAPRVGAFDLRFDGAATDLAFGIPAADTLLAGASTLQGRAARRDDGSLSLERLDIVTPRASAKGDLELSTGDVSADLDLRLVDLSDLAPGLPGPAQLTVTSAPSSEDRSKLILDGRGPGITVTGSAEVEQNSANLDTSFDLRAVAGRLSAFRDIAGLPLSGSLRVDATGQAALKTATGTARISASTTDLGIGQQTVDQILQGSGQITGTVRRSGDGTIMAEGLRARFPRLSADVDGRLSDSGLSADLQARLADLAVISEQLTGPLSITGTAAQDGGQTRLNLTARGDGDMVAQVSGSLAPGGSANLAVTGQVPLALANDALSPRSVTGQALVDLRVQGPTGLEALSGTVRISDGRLADPSSGQSLSDVNGTVRLNGAQSTVDLTGRIPAGGQLAVSGPILLTGRLPARLRVTGQNVVLRDPSLYETTAEVDITIDGPLRGGALISGQITLDETELRVPSSGTGTLGPLPEVIHLNPPSSVTRTLSRAGLSIAGIDARRGGDSTGGGARDAISFPLDLTVSAPARIFVRGRGLDAELGGTVALRGDTDTIIPSGRFDLIRGRIDILQQRFTLDEGFATLEGDFSPYLRLVATTETDDGGIAMIILEGDATEPDIRFDSIPHMPEDEVLSRLIFGKDLRSITPLQAVQLAAAVNTLAGRGNGGIVAQLRDSVGLDDLDITSDDQGNTAVTAGKYLTEDLYSNVTVGSDGTTQIDLNLDVTDDVTVRAGTASTGESTVGIFFERDY